MSQTMTLQKRRAMTLCQAVHAGAPEAREPCTLMVILGIELDSITMQAPLPKEMLDSLQEELHSFTALNSHTCTKQQFLSLAFTCKVIPGSFSVAMATL